MRMRYLLPLLVLMGLLALFAAALGRDPRALPSALVGRAAPVFERTTLPAGEGAPDGGATAGTLLASSALQGQVWVLNVWASWCVACRQEHALLVDLAGPGVPLYGLNYKDQPRDALDWLRREGDPYRASWSDADGRVGMDWGVYGVPETFVIDRAGVVRWRHAGPLTPQVLERELRPLLAELQR